MYVVLSTQLKLLVLNIIYSIYLRMHKGSLDGFDLIPNMLRDIEGVSILTFTEDFSNNAFILVSQANCTSICTEKLLDSGNPP